jgi:ketosteroid isomerase-like protein
MSSSSPTQVALDFIQHINGHSPDALAQSMTENHCFIDSTGRKVEGREQMRGGWGGYFSMFPDYEMTVESSVESGGIAVVFGVARGTFAVAGQLRPENRWEMPFAVRATVASGKVQEWRVYADNHVVFEIMSRNKG